MELQHYGVKGMKWGVRKKRPSTKKQSRNYAKKQAADYYKREKMSDSTLQSKVRRLQLENQYAQLSQQALQYNKSNGQKFIDSFMKSGKGNKSSNMMGDIANNETVKKVVKSAVKKAALAAV